MSWTVDRLLASAYPARRPEPGSSSALWALDVDGVLEDAGLGFPSVTPAAAAALQVMRQAGCLVVLDTGRSLEEVALRCDALGLDGGVAEYGSALWEAAAGTAESLVSPQEAAALDRVRARARELPGVHVDDRFRFSVRARRFAAGRFRGLEDGQVRELLEAGGGLVQMVPGGRQTDFAGASRDKGSGLERLLERLGHGGRVHAVGDAEADLPMLRRADRGYAPFHHDSRLDDVASPLRQDRQLAVLEAARREHPGAPRPSLAPLGRLDSLVVRLLALRDRPRAERALRALGPGALEVFRT
jgi:predicted mannosyl-3-phosphoglycerate phosphatase (HAD superfamily)